MSLLEEVTSLFRENASSWISVIRPAAAIAWDDWESGASNAKQTFRRVEELALSICSLSRTAGAPVERITKNALALASTDQLPFARLTVLTLFRNGSLTGNVEEWLAVLPEPAAVELFFGDFICGKFAPTAAAFAEVFPFATAQHEENCLRNILLSIKPFPISAQALMEVLHDLSSVSKASPEKIVDEIKRRIGKQKFKADLDVKKLLALPQDWRRAILAHDGLSRLFLVPEAVSHIAAAPQSISDTPVSILGSALKAELSRALDAGFLRGETISKIFKDKPAAEVLESEFDWSLLSKALRPIQLYENLNPAPSFSDFLNRTTKNRLAGNIAVLVISAMPAGATPRIEAESEIAQQLLECADLDVICFAVRTAKSSAQAFLVNSVLKTIENKRRQQAVVGAFFSSPLDKDVDVPTLNLLLPLTSKAKRDSVFKSSVELDLVFRDLLSCNEAFRNFYLARLERGKLPKNCASIEMFEAYGKLGEPGAQIIEILLKRCAKIAGNPTPNDLLKMVVQHAPALAGSVYGRRGIGPSSFIRIVDNDVFKEFSLDAQISILKLKSSRGKPALLIALPSISKPMAEWLGSKEEFRQLVALQAPEILKSKDLSLAELLAGATIRPGTAMATLEGFDRSLLLNALPDALRLIKDKPRVSAALELAVRSEISALPVFMRLVRRLAPPFETKDYGHRFDDQYTTYELPKKSGGKRIISAPAVHLKIAQRALLTLLYAEGFSDQAMGFVPGRSTKDNAARHVGRAIVVNADVKGFFPSTSYKRVYSLSRKLCGGTLSPLAARLFADICCHEGRLATGAPTSPAVSNLIMRDLDASLDRIATKLGVTYTRYADDVTFSGQSAAVWMLKPLTAHLAKLSYELDPKKTNIFRKGRRQVVTGAVVNQKVNLARPLRKLLRAAVDHRIKGKQPFFRGKPMNDAVLNGYVSYLKMLSPESAAPLISKLRECPGWKF